MRALVLVAVVAVGCGAPTFVPQGVGAVLPLCGPCFRVLGEVCIDDGTCPGSACAASRPDLPAMSWVNDPGLNLHVDFDCR